MVKNLPANLGDLRDLGSISGWGRSPGGGHSNSVQYSCLENPLVRGAWQAIVHGVTKSLDTTEHLALTLGESCWVPKATQSVCVK